MPSYSSASNGALIACGRDYNDIVGSGVIERLFQRLQPPFR
jgi:hypothetical protein